MKLPGNYFSLGSSRHLLIALGLVVAFTGCNIIPPPSADLTRYYVLTHPMAETSATVPWVGGLTLGLKNVDVAPYLRKGTLVVRLGENEVTFPDDARWGVPIEQDIARALRAGLSAAPAVSRVLVSPFPFEGKRDYDVNVQVLRCEGVAAAGGQPAKAVFSAVIEITATGEGMPVVARKVFVSPEMEWNGNDFSALTAQLSAAVGALGREIVLKLPSKK